MVNLIVPEVRANEIKAASQGYASMILDDRALCDIELLAVGGFSPLKSFMNQKDYASVLHSMRLADGTFWPLPVTLPVKPDSGVEVGQPVALRDVYLNLIGLLHVTEIFLADTAAEAAYQMKSASESTTAATQNTAATHYASGRLEVIRVPPHFDFINFRKTPAQLRAQYADLGWSKVVALPARSPIFRPQEEFARQTGANLGAGLLIQAIVGATKPGDVDHYTRIRCHKALVDSVFPASQAMLSLLPLAPRPAAHRLQEVLLEAIVHRNYGCTHFIIPPKLSSSSDQASFNLAESAAEIGIGLIENKPYVYLPERDQYLPADTISHGAMPASLSESQVQEEYFAQGTPLPPWFCRPTVAAILAEAHLPRHNQGLTIWFTGLSGSGKSTVAHALVERLAEFGRNVSFLDGDEIRTHLSKGLGFSREDRDTNIKRVGYVAGLVAAHGGTTICSVISPYRSTREHARVASKGNFGEIFCDTPLAVCESRDVKGLYAKARDAVSKGNGLGFTGIDDPYEPPLNPEVTLDTSTLGVSECVEVIIAKLKSLGYIRG